MIKYICSCHNKKFESKEKLYHHYYHEKNKNNPDYKIQKIINAKKFKEENPEYIRNYILLNKEKILSQAKIYYINNKTKRINYNKHRWIINKKKINLENKKKYETNINAKLRWLLTNRLYRALKGKTKSEHTLDLLGCSIEELKNYLERQFKEGMNWNNYSYRGWHIDHIKPCASFNLENIEEQRKCFHYTNLQPLWATENQEKGSLYLGTRY